MIGISISYQTSIRRLFDGEVAIDVVNENLRISGLAVVNDETFPLEKPARQRNMARY